MSLIVLLLGLASLPLLIVDLVFGTEVALGLKPLRRRPDERPLPRLALVVPAHNEEGVVRQSVASMIASSPAGTRVLVVAHNCSDGTADQAEAGGAEVVRLDRPDERGKGYALAGGRDALVADPPEVVIVIDADCVPETGAIATLAATAYATGRPVQASYLFLPQPTASPMVQISSFAMLVKNLVRQRGGRRIGAPALLTGSGMAFPWKLFAEAQLATGNIVEDLALGIELTARGKAPIFEERATIWSTPSSEGGTGTQRARWEGGFLKTARSVALPLILHGLARVRFPLVWMGLHLLTPPLTLILMANGALLAAWWLLFLFGGPARLLFLSFVACVAIVAVVLAAWAAAGRTMISGRVLMKLPFYLFWKIALYGRILRRKEKAEWTRTERVE